MNNERIADLLIEQGLMDRAQADDLLETTQNGKTIAAAIVDKGVLDETQFYETLADALGTEVIDLSEIEISASILELIPAGLARLHRALPIDVQEDVIRVALVDPLDVETIEDLRFVLGREVQVVVAPGRQIEDQLKKHYGEDASTLEILKQLGQSGQMMNPAGKEANGNDVQAEANATPIIRFVDLILHQAIQDRASDIHFEPFENEFKVRYRVDGALYEMTPPPRHLALPVISRVKVMANMNIAERRLPQDGRIQKKVAGRSVDLRVSSLPTQFGESLVLRVLDRATVNLDLEALGMPPAIYNHILEVVHRPNGIFIVTGPTGSGKTTTLYSCLRKINTIDSKLLTAEEPVEYDLEGVIQVAVNDAIGLSFARVLRAFLRQDPDRIMIGETRDLETAQIAIQAALTGHLVFTTLHTSDAPGTVVRLIDMGVEPFLISSTLDSVLSQRLLRRICDDCKTAYRPNESLLMQLNFEPGEIGQCEFYYGAGCERCHRTGYKGRIGIYELMKMNDPLRELINQRPPSVVLKEKAIELGMTTLRQDGIRCIFDGQTTVEEVLKYT
jgi:type IV pilus assembly protein PilB